MITLLIATLSVLEQPIIVRAEPLFHVKDVRIQLLKGIGSVGERIKVELDLHSGLHEVTEYKTSKPAKKKNARYYQ